MAPSYVHNCVLNSQLAFYWAASKGNGETSRQVLLVIFHSTPISAYSLRSPSFKGYSLASAAVMWRTKILNLCILEFFLPRMRQKMPKIQFLPFASFVYFMNFLSGHIVAIRMQLRNCQNDDVFLLRLLQNIEKALRWTAATKQFDGVRKNVLWIRREFLHFLDERRVHFYTYLNTPKWLVTLLASLLRPGHAADAATNALWN